MSYPSINIELTMCNGSRVRRETKHVWTTGLDGARWNGLTNAGPNEHRDPTYDDQAAARKALAVWLRKLADTVENTPMKVEL